jgi:hypothetical protein
MIQPSLAVAVHEHPLPAVIVKLPLPAADEYDAVVGFKL